jgi:hypothetical protein
MANNILGYANQFVPGSTRVMTRGPAVAIPYWPVTRAPIKFFEELTRDPTDFCPYWPVTRAWSDGRIYYWPVTRENHDLTRKTVIFPVLTRESRPEASVDPWKPSGIVSWPAKERFSLPWPVKTSNWPGKSGFSSVTRVKRVKFSPDGSGGSTGQYLRYRPIWTPPGSIWTSWTSI